MLGAILGGASLLGKLFGGAAKGSADQRITENQQRLQQMQAQNSDALQRALLQSNNANTRASMANDNAYQRASMTNANNLSRAGLDLDRRRYGLQEPSVQARQALAGSLLSRIKPVQINGMPAGMGVRSSIIDAIGPEAREAGSLLAQRGLSGLQRGPAQFDALPDAALPNLTLPEFANLPPATQAALQKSGLLEKILGGVGLAGSIIGGLGELGGFEKGGGGTTLNNQMASAYSGMDQYGNPSQFTLPRTGLSPNLASRPVDAAFFGGG